MNDAGAYLGQFLFVGIIVLIIVVAIWASAKETQRRQDTYKQLAAELGLSYVEPEPAGCFPMKGSWFDSTSDSIGIASGLGTWPFQEGRSRTVGNAVNGMRDGHQFAVFEYSYVIQAGKSSTTYKFTVAATQLPLMAPDLVIQPESFGSKIGKFFGIRDIEFESNEFNERFYVKCRDRKFAFDVINPQMMEFLLAIPAAHWTLTGPYLVQVWVGWANPDGLRAIVRMQDDFVKAIPGFIMIS